MHCIDDFVFTSDCKGHLKQFVVKNKKLLKDYGRPHEFGVSAMAGDGETLLTGGIFILGLIGFR